MHTIPKYASKRRYVRMLLGVVGGIISAVAMVVPASAAPLPISSAAPLPVSSAAPLPISSAAPLPVSKAAPVPVANLATEPDVTPSFNGAVRAVAYLGGIVFVGGDFTGAYVGNRAYERNHLAAMDASTGALLPWAPDADGAVNAITIAGNAVFVVGAFNHINHIGRQHLAAVGAANGRVLRGFSHAIEGPVFALAAGNGRLYIGGRVLSVDRRERGGAAAFSLTTGALLDEWQPETDGRIESIAVGGGPLGESLIYLAGKFHAVNNTPGTGFVAAVTPEGEVVRQFRAKARAVVHAVTVVGDRVYLGTGGAGGQGLALALNGRRLWAFTVDGDVVAIGVLGGAVLFGGHFDNACRSSRRGDHGRCLDGSVSRVKIAAVAATNGTMLPWTANANGIAGVIAMTADLNLGKVAVGGQFTSIAGAPRQRFAQFSVR